jgi:hypothetical protein
LPHPGSLQISRQRLAIITGKTDWLPHSSHFWIGHKRFDFHRRDQVAGPQSLFHIFISLRTPQAKYQVQASVIRLIQPFAHIFSNLLQLGRSLLESNNVMSQPIVQLRVFLTCQFLLERPLLLKFQLDRQVSFTFIEGFGLCYLFLFLICKLSLLIKEVCL